MQNAVHQPARFSLTGAMDDRVRQMCGAPARRGDLAHPIHAYLGAMSGIPQGIGEYSRKLGLAFDLGPVLGSCHISYPGQLRIGQVYDVATRVVDQQRKPSRRFGRADHLTLAITLSDRDGLVSTLEFTMITPVAEHDQP